MAQSHELDIAINKFMQHANQLKIFSKVFLKIKSLFSRVDIVDINYVHSIKTSKMLACFIEIYKNLWQFLKTAHLNVNF